MLSTTVFFTWSLLSFKIVHLLAVTTIKVIITQTTHPCDTNPVINLSEVSFLYKSVLQSLPDAAFQFPYESSGYPAAKCNDGIIATGNNPFNMCKSGNDQPSESLVIDLGSTIAFDQIVVYNAFGFNNPNNYDVGGRIVGATISVFFNGDTTATFSDTFTVYQDSYTFNYPSLSANPTAAPTSASPTTTPSPSRAPTTISPTVYVPPGEGFRAGPGDDGDIDVVDGAADDDQSGNFLLVQRRNLRGVADSVTPVVAAV